MQKAERPSLKAGPAGIPIEKVMIVALYAPDNGQVLHRHTVKVLKGGQDISADAATKTAFNNVTTQYKQMEADTAFQAYLKKSGKRLLPIAKMKARVIDDPALADELFRINPKTGEPEIIKSGED